MSGKIEAAGKPVDGGGAGSEKRETEGQEEIEFKLERGPERLPTEKPRMQNT